MFYYFLFWSNLIQKRLCSCVVLITYLITLSLEKEIIVLEKVLNFGSQNLCEPCDIIKA